MTTIYKMIFYIMKTILLSFTIFLSVEVFAQEIDFYLPDINNEENSFEDLKGDKLTIIDFWATWCKPCTQLMPKLNDIKDKWSDDIEIIGISIDGPRSMNKVRPFVTTMGIKYPILLDPNQEVSGDLSISIVPSLLLVNSKGEVLWSHEGYALGDEVKIDNKITYYLEKN